MAVDPVPYVVHGAKHSADVFRQAFHDATSGAKGVSKHDSLQVQATPTPSNQVRVSPGGLIMPNTYSGGGGQSYTGRNASETLIDIPASDSTGSRQWNIIFRIQDPQFGGQAPADPLAGPYAFIECVSASATITDPHYRLAKVTVPASTATITQAMIYDFRNVANPIIGTKQMARPRVAADGTAENDLATRQADGGEFFPGGAGYANQASVTIPDEAVAMIVEAHWSAVRYTGGRNVFGSFWIEYGDEYREHTWPNNRQYEFATQQFQFDSAASGNTMRTNWILADTVTVPAKLRGKSTTFVFKAALAAAAQTGVQCDAMSGLNIKVTFLREPSNWGGFN